VNNYGFLKKKHVVMLLNGDFIYPFLDSRVYKEADSLGKNQYDVSIVCRYSLGKTVPRFEEYRGIKVYRILQNIRYFPNSLLWRLPFYILHIFKSTRRSLKLKPDIVHCHDLDTLLIGVILKLLTRKPIIFDAHEDFPGMLESVHSKMLSRLARFLEKILIKIVDGTIAAEAPYVNIMEKHYGVSPVVVMNFPNLDSFHPTVDPSSVIRKHRLEGRVVISHIGVIGRNRGIYETLEALHYLPHEEIRYMVIGRTTTAEWDRIREAIRRFNLDDKVILLVDGVDYEEVPKYYKASDISMVLLYPEPNYVTSLPTKLFESLAVGTPVLAGNLDYLGGVVTKYNVGLCADSRDPKDIAVQLDALISDEQMRMRMGQNGLKAIREEFNWDESAKRLIEVYRSIVPN
jgi:1,2-diacylglycerol 3-alpha-glucosyltransferase